MAFFICESPKYVTIRPEKQHYSQQTGHPTHKDRELWVQLRRREAPPWAREIGERTFAFRGYPPTADKLEWMAFIDTNDAQLHHNWTEEEKALVDDRLRNEIEGIVEVLKPQPEPPWETYASRSPRQNLELAKATGTPVEALIEYEEQTGEDEIALSTYRAALGASPEEDAVVEA